MKLFALTILCVLASAYAVEECYVCSTDDGNTNCGEIPFDSTKATSKKCDALDYEGSKILKTIIKPTPQSNYACTEVVIEKKGSSEKIYEKTCTILEKEVHNQCDYLKEKLPEGYSFAKCRVCTDQNNCNTSGAAFLVQSLMLFLSCIFFAVKMH